MRMFIKKKIFPWLRLVRVPNLFTVPGDPIAGAVVFAGDSLFNILPLAIAASLCFYCFGLVTNDIADLKTDRNERPDRPLPSGAVSLRAAIIFSLILAIAGLIFTFIISGASFTIGIILLVSIILYNFRFKQNDCVGVCLLAFCRVLNLIIGVAGARIIPMHPLLFCALVFAVFTYIFGVSLVARNEVETDKAGKNMLITGILLFTFSSFVWLFLGFVSITHVIRIAGEMPPAIILAGLLSGYFIIKTLMGAFGVASSRENLPEHVGALIKNIVFLQASACAFAGFSDVALCVMVLYLPALFLGKLFYSS